MASESNFPPDFFDSSAEQLVGTKFFSREVASSDDIFSILEAFEDDFTSMTPLDRDHQIMKCGHVIDNGLNELVSSTSCLDGVQKVVEVELEPGTKRQKVSPGGDPPLKTNHVTVERNRRKTMNDHLAILRSLMPCFYVKRGDQASIIGGVVDYITELQQVLQSLEAKKKRKVYSDVLSPRLVSSPRTLPLSPRSKPPLSPRPSLPTSPRTPQSASPYRHRLPSTVTSSYLVSPSSSTLGNSCSTPASPCNSSSANSDIINELVANSKSSMADVEVKFSGANLLLKTTSPRLKGQATKIISVLEDLSLEILNATINTVDQTMINSFTIKIGIECKISAEDLAQHIQLTFS